ncbi:MAG: ribonucleotide-diphosphate reductase subunit beta, partial [Actinomycetota bacterium]
MDEIDDLYVQIDDLARERPGPLELYRRWEQQQWSATELDFSVDRQHWAMIEPAGQDDLMGFFAGFFVGEQAVTDTLSPLVMGAPSEESRLFLATQLVDEARHSYFFARFYSDVLGQKGTMAETLNEARGWTETDSFNQIFNIDLIESTEAVRLDPTDYSTWVEAITLYHMLVEGVLALV